MKGIVQRAMVPNPIRRLGLYVSSASVEKCLGRLKLLEIRGVHVDCGKGRQRTAAREKQCITVAWGGNGSLFGD